MTGKEKPKAPAKATDTPEGERIAKVLSRAGIASRREAERLIELGEVKVNGKTITSPALNVTAKDRITVRGEPVGQPEPARHWLLSPWLAAHRCHPMVACRTYKPWCPARPVA